MVLVSIRYIHIKCNKTKQNLESEREREKKKYVDEKSTKRSWVVLLVLKNH